MTSTAVIIAPQGDEHACVVAKRVESFGARAIILDSAEYPSRWRLTYGISGGDAPQFVLEHDGVEVNESNLAGVWWRRPRRYVAPSQVLELHLRQFIVSESRQAFEGWLLSLGRKVINSPSAESAARKIVQLKIAAEVGLVIPRSLITNSPERAKVFSESTGSATVYKPFTGVTWNLLATRRLSRDVLEHLSSIAHAPVIFQEEIAKVADIRANIIDDQIFAIEIRSKQQEPPVDWRAETDCEYVEHTLPEPISGALVALVSRLGLRFAACDLALTPEGRYVFFEANPGGQWLFAEIMVGQPLSTALARALLEGPQDAAGEECSGTGNLKRDRAAQ